MVVQQSLCLRLAVLSFIFSLVLFVRGEPISSSHGLVGVGDFVASPLSLSNRSSANSTGHTFPQSTSTVDNKSENKETARKESSTNVAITTETVSPVPHLTASSQNRSSRHISSTAIRSYAPTRLSLTRASARVSSTRQKPSALSGGIRSQNASATSIIGPGSNVTNSSSELLQELEGLTAQLSDIPYLNSTLNNGTTNMSACFQNWEMYSDAIGQLSFFWLAAAITSSTSHLTSTSSIITSYASRFQDVTSAAFTSAQQNWTTTLTRTDYSSWAANFSTSWSTFENYTTATQKEINVSTLGVPTPSCVLPSIVPACQAQWDNVKPMNYNWSIHDSYPICQQAIVKPQVCSAMQYEYTGTQSGLSLGPGCTANCQQCIVTGKSVELIYWPVKTAPGQKNVTITPTETGLVTATGFGTTFTSPTVYISFDQLWANNHCGRPVGTTIDNKIIPVSASDVSTITNQWGIYQVGGEPNPPPPSVQGGQLNFADLNQPYDWSSYLNQPACACRYFGTDCPCSTVLRDFKPQLVLPPQVRALDPAWASCEMQWDGVYDPPYALYPAEQAAAPSPTDPFSNLPTATPATPCMTPVPPTPTSTGAAVSGDPGNAGVPENSGQPADPGPSSAALQPAPPARSADPGGVIVSMVNGGSPQNPDPASGGGGSGSGAAASPAPGPDANGSANDPDAGTGSVSVAGSNGDPGAGGGTSGSGSGVGNGVGSEPDSGSRGSGSGSGSGGSVAPAGGVSAGDSNGDPGAGAGAGPAVGNGVSGGSGGSGSDSGSGGSAVPTGGPPAGGSNGAPEAGPGAGSAAGNGASSGNGSGSGSGGPGGDGGPGSGGNADSAGSQPSPVPEGAPGSSPGNAPADNPAAPAGSPPAPAGNSQPLQEPQPITSAAIITIGSETHTVASGGALILGSATIVPGGPAATVSGQVVSVASGGVAVGGNTVSYLQPLAGASQAQPTAIITIGSQVHTVQAGGALDLGSTTLVPGGPAATVSGKVVSLAPQGVAVASSTVAYSAPPVSVSVAGSPSSGAVFTFGTQTFTAPAGSGGSLVMGSTTLRPGGALTFSGTVISMGTSGVVVGSSTLPDVVLPSNGATQTPEPVLTVQGAPYTAINGGSFLIGGQTLVPGGTITAGGSTIILSPSGQAAVANINGVSQTLSTAFGGAGSPPSDAILTIGSQVITASDLNGPDIVAIGSQILTQGSAAATIAGQAVSLGQNGLVVGGTQTIPISALGSGTALLSASSGAVFSIGSETITAVDPAGSSGVVIIGSQTLTLGGADATISGQEVSLASGGIVLGGSSTIPLSTIPTVSTNAVASVTFTGVDGAVQTAFSLPGGNGVAVIGGATLSAGGPAATIDGQSVSEANGGLVVGGSTIPFSTMAGTGGVSAPTGSAGGSTASGNSGIAGLSSAKESFSWPAFAISLQAIGLFIFFLVV
ncbi:hypothetical protein EV356DRAFT_534306 [Viridothelium virens]|uniref:Uncharacterized protein n=1 Tax=Viridothelium virens TaxID=1048519 RepID=A0A6A6H4K2_VIRVR|nr:hypothetical protein EV356DRAFT_534306 [Viridothelium virens]